MRKGWIIPPLLIGVLLTGCLVNNKTEDQIPVIGIEPPSGLPEEDSGNEIAERPTLRVDNRVDTTTVLRDSFCLEETKEDCTIEPKNPRELLKKSSPMRVKQGDAITFYFEVKKQSITYVLRGLEKVQVTQFGKFNEESNSEFVGNQITAPMEEGIYYYYVIASWDGDTKGKATYAFSVSVQ